MPSHLCSGSIRHLPLKPQFELSPPCLNFGAAPKPAEVSGLCVIHYKRLLVVILTVEFSRQIFLQTTPFSALASIIPAYTVLRLFWAASWHLTALEVSYPLF